MKTEKIIKEIDGYLLKKYPKELSEEDFFLVCDLFNKELFGDFENSLFIFSKTLGLYGYDYNDYEVKK